jgi:SAM-dependent methyltransferase
MQPRPHREAAYATLSGRGLEIGAFHEPAVLPPAATVEYFDAMDAARAAELFPEIPAESFVTVDHIGDIDQDGLQALPSAGYDFVIANHVIEHLANPIKLVRDTFALTRPGGTVILSAPDKDYTYDKNRPLTPYDHLWSDFVNNVAENDDEHYMDFFRGAAPHVLEVDPVHLPYNIQRVRERREHAHVWDSESFGAFMRETLARLDIAAIQLAESLGPENGMEYFGAWQKPS